MLPNTPNTSDIDTNIDNYSIQDLIEFFQLDHINKDNVSSKANEFINRYSDASLRSFFYSARDKLLNFVAEENNTAMHNITKFTRNIYVNSLYRQHVVYDGQFGSLVTPHESIYSETNFAFNLTERLKNVTELTFSSVQIPYTWYNIDSAYNTNFFYFNDSKIEINSGNYTIDTLVSTINAHVGFSSKAVMSYDLITHKVSIQSQNNNGSLETIQIDWYKRDENYRNFSLGWLLGFRDDVYVGVEFTAEVVYNLTQMHYFFLIVDEFNNNRDNNDLVTIYNQETILSTPAYFTNDLEITEIDGNLPVYGQSVPRQITQAQQYTINEILASRQTLFSKIKFPPTSDILAIIPIAMNDETFGTSVFSYANYGADRISRKYYGQIDIDRMHIKLVNCHGQLVNLNGSNWSLNLQSTHLV